MKEGTSGREDLKIQVREGRDKEVGIKVWEMKAFILRYISCD